MMGKILFLLLLVATVWVVWSIRRRNNRLDNDERLELEAFRKTQRAQKEQRGTTMLKCDHCGVYYPKNDGVMKGDKHYCSRRCAQLD